MNRATVAASVGAAFVVLVLIVTLVAPVRSAVGKGMATEVRASAATNRSAAAPICGASRSASSKIIRWSELDRKPFPTNSLAYSRAVLSPAAVRHYEQFRVESPHNEMLGVASGAGIPASHRLPERPGRGHLCSVARNTWSEGRRSAPRAVGRDGRGTGPRGTGAFMTPEITGSWLFWILVGAGVGIASVVTADGEGATMSDSPDGLHLAAEAHPGLDPRHVTEAINEVEFRDSVAARLLSSRLVVVDVRSGCGSGDTRHRCPVDDRPGV